MLVASVMPLAQAHADSLQIDQKANPDRSFYAVQELSHEVIITAGEDDRVDVRVRVALHNASNHEQDTVLNLALPHAAEIVGLQVARDGVWRPGQATGIAAEPGRREPGVVFVRPLAPVVAGDLPGAEVVAFSLESATTIQVELQLQVPVQLRGDRWHLELPGRGDDRESLARERRILVRTAGEPRFWVDGRDNAGQPVLSSSPEDRVVVTWPATIRKSLSSGTSLEAQLVARPDGPGTRTGTFRLAMRLGATLPPRPDHIVVLFDRSRSTGPGLHRDAMAMLGHIFDALPPRLSFDAISFARQAQPLLPESTTWPSVHDKDARAQLAATLDAGSREQGTDLTSALRLAGQRIAARGARKPLVVVITDGMLPMGAGPGPLSQEFVASLGPNAATVATEFLFVVDEPLLQRSGLAPEHPIAQTAAGLGARISLLSLAHGHSPAGQMLAQHLLHAPGVLSDLQIKLPSHVTLVDTPPTGLVAGNLVTLHGTYHGAVPSLQLRGVSGGLTKSVRMHKKLRAVRVAAPPAALVASIRPTGLEQTLAEGFAVPPWYSRKHQRGARLNLAWASRGRGEDRGRLDEKILRRYLGTRVFPRARACYNQALTRNQQLQGRVLFEFEVGKGEVMLATTDVSQLSQPDAGFARCLGEAAWMLDIPAGKLDDQIYRIRYPLVFNPPKVGQPAIQDDPNTASTIELLLNLGR